MRELAIEKGLFSEEDHRRFSEWAESLGPSGGSKLVAKAWTDPEFKARLLADGTEACKEVGIDWLDPTGVGTPSDYTYFYVLENTPEVHNVIVCTLCSCYPRPVLGMSPDWYRTPNYRRRLVRWPREVLAEFGLHFGPDVEVRVHDSNQKSRFMVMPMRPDGTEGWTEEQSRGDRHPRHHDRRRAAAGGLDGVRTSVCDQRSPREHRTVRGACSSALEPDARREDTLPELERKPDPWESACRRRASACPGAARWTTSSAGRPRTCWVRPPTTTFRCTPGRRWSLRTS